MENIEATSNIECEMPQLESLPLENNSQHAESVIQTDQTDDNTDPLKVIDQTRNAENQLSVETTDVSCINVSAETNSVVSSDNSMPPLPPPPSDDKGQLPQPPASYSADYNMQNYANYNYMYNYNNYYGYPYPQYQWDYNSQQYYQPYQNYYNYNYNANQAQTSKPPPPPPDAVQLPVEEKPANKTNTAIVDDSNRYSPTAETDDDDTLKGSENNKADVLNEQPPPKASISCTNAVPTQTVSAEQSEFQKSMPNSESVENKMQQLIFPSVTPDQLPIVPNMAQIQLYNIPVQQPNYSINPQIQSTESVNDLTNQHQNSPALNGKDDSTEKVSKGSTVLGKTQAKKRLMAFSMMKQKLQEQNNLANENPSSDFGEGNDVEFVPELNVFQTVSKKKVVANKKVTKVIKAQQTIEQIEEMKKDELLQGNNAALYQHLLRSGGNEAPILQKLGIESLAEKYSAKIREQDKRMKRHHHRRRDDNRRGSHKYRRRSHSKSRSRSRSAEKPKMRALEVKSWKDFVNGGFHFDRFRRFKMDEAEELKEKERKSRTKKRHGDSRSDGKNQNTEPIISTDAEKGNGDQKLRYNILDQKKEIRKGLEVVTNEADFTRDFPSYIIQYTRTKPVLKYSANPAFATCHLQNRQQMLATLLPEIEIIVHKFLSDIKPKKLKENTTDNYICIDDNLLLMMKDKNIYPFKGWWPKTCFIVTQVKEDPNIEIDTDALINQFTTSKRTKKSRFNDDTSLVDIRPTVPSKWDSDYDGSPATEKVADIEVTHNVEMNTIDDVSQLINTEENNPPDISHQEEAMDTASDIGENEPKIEINVSPILLIPSQESQGHAKLDTEYEEFLKIVSAEKNDEKVENNLLTSAVEKEDENNQSMNSVSLNDESVEIGQFDKSEDSTSSVGSVSLNNTVDEPMDVSFVKKLKKNKKSTNKKSKKYKKKEGKKNKRKSSSSESSQVSESESESSSEVSESSASTDSTSSVEKKRKKKSKDKKKKKSKANYKKKHKGDKIKIKNPEEEIDSNSSILNLLEKAFNVEIKKRPLDNEEPKQKKKKHKHEKKKNKSNGENEDKLEKVKECLKETFTKLVKTDKGGKNQSLSCDDTAVSEVLKYLKMDEEKEIKNTKSKKNMKRKYDSDISSDEKIIKQFILDDSSKLSDNERKKKSKKKKSSSKKLNDSDGHLKKKSKRKSRTSDTSDTEDGERSSKHKKIKKENDAEHFFGLRPNDWNINDQSSMRGFIHHSVVNNSPPSSKVSDLDENIKLIKSNPLQLRDQEFASNCNITEHEISDLHNNLIEYDEHSNRQLEIPDKNIDRNDDNMLPNITGEKVLIDSRNSDKETSFEDNNDEISNKSQKCDNYLMEHKNNLLPSSVLLLHDKLQEANEDLVSILKPTLSNPFKDNDNSAITLIKPVEKPISYRDKVKMNLKKLSNCKNIPFVFGFSSPLGIIKSNNLEIDKIGGSFDLNREETKPKLEESNILKVDKPKMVISPQPQMKPDVVEIVSPKIDLKTDNCVRNPSFSWENSEESNLENSEESNSYQSTDSSESEIDEASCEHSEQMLDEASCEHSEQMQSSLKQEGNLKEYNRNQPCVDEIFSNSNEVKDEIQLYSPEMTDSNINSDSENKEQEHFTVVDNIVAKKEIITPSNLSNLVSYEERSESNVMEIKNYDISVKTVSSVEKDFGSVCSHNSIIANDDSKTNNELFTRWKSDWSELNESVTEINKSSGLNDSNNSKLKKISRWDKESNEKRKVKNEKKKVEEVIDETNNYEKEKVHEEEELMDETSNYEMRKEKVQEEEKLMVETSNCAIEELKSTSSIPNDFSEEQIQPCEITSINSGKNSAGDNEYSEIWSNDYCDDYSQTYEQFSRIPLYSDMKSIEPDELCPIDYSFYENYNPNYEYCDEDYEMWKSMDSSQQMTSIPTISGTLSSPVQIVNVSEISQSDIISHEQTEFLKDEAEFPNGEIEFSTDQAINSNIVTIIPDVEDEVVENEKSLSAIREEQFVQLYQQHFQHYNQNPVKYSMSNPVLNRITNVNLDAPEKLPQEDLSDIETDKTIPVPLRERAYMCITKDDDNNLYITSDNYIAYCAVEDGCMVHIAVDSSSHDGIADKVRHCFNIYQNGTTIEYWLHADLIPFHVPSDAESGVFSDDEEDSLESDSGQEDHVIANDDNEDEDNEDDGEDNENSDMIEGEWEIIDSDSESNVDSWLENPSIIEKYGGNNIDIGQTLTDINQEEYESNSSDSDSDKSDVSGSNVFNSSEIPNITTNSLSHLFKRFENKSSNILDETMTKNDLEKTENTAKMTNIKLETDHSVTLSDPVVKDVGIKSEYVMLEKNNHTTYETLTDHHDSILLESEENNYNKKESDVLAKESLGILIKEEVVTEDLLLMNTIINQKLLIQRLKIRAKEKIQEKLPDTVMVHYSDNVETFKSPFLGKFQPPTISILAKQQSKKSKLSKRVSFADGIYPGDNLAASPTHDDVGRPLSPPPLKALMRETLKLKRNLYPFKPFKRSKMRTKLTMLNKKVATVSPSIKETTSSVIEYYVSQRRLQDLPIPETTTFRTNDSPNSDDDHHRRSKISTPPRPTRELTPVPSDNDCWDDYDDDNIKDNR